MRRITARSTIVTFAIAVFFTFGFLLEAMGSEFFLLDDSTSPDSGHFVEGVEQSLPADFPVSKRFRPVQITSSITTGEGLSQGDTLILNLFDDTNYAALIDRISLNANGTASIRGRLEAYPLGEVLISTTGGRSLVSIRIPETGEHYIIQSESNTTTHYLLDLEVGKLRKLEDLPPLIPDIDTDKETQDSLELNDIIVNGPLDPVNIDVMIVYTPAARNWANTSGGGINNVVAQAMEKAQLALDNGNTILTMTLVYSSEISYTESGSTNTDLDRLTNTSDGYLDDAHTWRDQYGADLVVLFTMVEDTGGLGWLLNTTSGLPAYGFSIARVQQASWTYTTIHELGHNMGCHHHKEQNYQPGPGLFSYSAGWRWIGNDSGKYCSVMTYESGEYFPDGQTHTRVGHFSNPYIFYQGVATGDAADGDNARNIREIKDVVSAYRTFVRPCGDCEPEDVNLGTITTVLWGGSVSGNCGNEGKWVGQFVGEAGATYHFDLCPDSPGSSIANFDADIKITNSSCNILDGEDGTCNSPLYLPNDFQWICTSNGTYYVIIAPWDSYDSHTCEGTTNDTFILEYYKEGGVLDPPVLHAEPNITPGLRNTIWWDAVPDATWYYAECANDADFANTVIGSGWISDTNCIFTGLDLEHKYWYRVKAAPRIESWSQTSQAEFQTDTLVDTRATNGGDVVLTGGPVPPVVDTVGGTNSSYDRGGGCFNGFYVTKSTVLTQIEVYLGISTSCSIEFVVYEGGALFFDTYDRIHSSTLASSGTGTKFYNSGSISVPLEAGKYYMIGAVWSSSVIIYYNSGHSSPSFANHAGYGTYSGFPSPDILSDDDVFDLPYTMYHRYTTDESSDYASSGSVVSTTIELPANGNWGWDVVDLNATMPENTELTVDVLNGSDESVILADVNSSTDINWIAATELKLRANLSTDDPDNTPALHDWSVSYAGPCESSWSNVESSLQCDTLCDFDNNNEINFADFAILAGQWQQEPNSPSADIAPEVLDNFVDKLDLAVFVEKWLLDITCTEQN